jgi:hypothetical protein
VLHVFLFWVLLFLYLNHLCVYCFGLETCALRLFLRSDCGDCGGRHLILKNLMKMWLVQRLKYGGQKIASEFTLTSSCFSSNLFISCCWSWYSYYYWTAIYVYLDVWYLRPIILNNAFIILSNQAVFLHIIAFIITLLKFILIKGICSAKLFSPFRTIPWAPSTPFPFPPQTHTIGLSLSQKKILFAIFRSNFPLLIFHNHIHLSLCL